MKLPKLLTLFLLSIVSINSFSIVEQVPIDKIITVIQAKCFNSSIESVAEVCDQSGEFEGISNLDQITQKYIAGILQEYRNRTETEKVIYVTLFLCNLFDQTEKSEVAFHKAYDLDLAEKRKQLLNPLNTKESLTKAIQSYVVDKDMDERLGFLLGNTIYYLNQQRVLFPKRSQLRESIAKATGKVAVINYFQGNTPKESEDAMNELYWREKDEKALIVELAALKAEHQKVDDEIGKIQKTMTTYDQLLYEGKFSGGESETTKGIIKLKTDQDVSLKSFWRSQNFVEYRAQRSFEIKYSQFPMMRAQIIEELYSRGFNLGVCRQTNKHFNGHDNDPKAFEKLNIYKNYSRRLLVRKQAVDV
jgi:hypothetical protein